MNEQDINEELYKLSHLLSQEVPELSPSNLKFLHYSSLEAFYAITETQRLRFTSAKSTNDPSEFVYGTQIVEEALSALVAQHGKGALGCLEGAMEALRERTFSPFIFCMSEAIEDEAQVGELSQWRLYGSNGRGVALVFDATPLKAHKKLVEAGSYPRKVVYGRQEGVELVKSIVLRFMRQLESLPSIHQDVLRKSPEDAVMYLVNCVFWLPSVIKHESYRHEREVRLVRGDIGAIAGNPLIFFDRGGIRRPAIEREFAEVKAGGKVLSPLSGVIIGPSGDQSSIEDGVAYFMRARDWEIEIKRSDIPYRALS